MELRPGYKMTEVGVIPEDWDAKPLGEGARFRTGPFGSALHQSDYTEDGIPVINPMHIVDGGIEPTRTMTIGEKVAKQLSVFRLKPGEIVIGRRGDMGRCAVVQAHQEGWLCGTGSMIIRCGNDTDADFLQRVLSSPKTISAIEDASVGTTMINLNQSTLAGLRIQLPPIPEQCAIAQALSDVDSLLATLDQVIVKKRDLKQAAMQQLLTGKTRLPGFSGDWETKQLKDFAHLSKTGINPSSTPESLFTHFSLPAFDANETPVIESGASIGSNKFVVPPGAVLLSKLNPRIPRVWAPNCMPSNSVCSTEFLVLIPNEGVDRNFFKYLCASTAVASQMELHAIGTTGSHQRIHPTQVMAIEVKTPIDDDERSAISSVLRDIDAELSNLNRRRDKTVELKQAMMQELLTGKTRLV